ncbi:ABC transporter substrate-binding protein [Parapusillimonas sp. SGNA-6]|jgi:branched-chain amino acid transport system substrate-binding protein|nr:ABC transporter substrate-binding protein [Parapusillimonas sp. SGNA-6]
MKKTIMAIGLAACFSAPAFAQGDVFRIGVLNDQSGTYSDFGGVTSVVAAKMAVEDFGGKVLGKQIEVLSADHQNKTDIGTATARKWFDVDGVEAIADLTNSAVALAVQGLAKERGKITLASGPFSTKLTNEACSPTGFHWTFDTYASSVGTARGVLEQGGKEWFILAADYAFGQQMAADLTKTVQANGGKVLGQVNHPLNTSDFASFLLQAQSSKAKIIGLANGGTDTVNSIKQAAEFGLVDQGQNLVALAMVISDVHALGLDKAKGLVATTAYYWDRDDESRAFAKRFEEITKRKPGMIQAGVYSSVMHYLKAVKAAGTADGKKVAEKMREMPVNDFFTKNGKVRVDGRMEHDMFLIEAKRPEESKGPWDYYKVLRTIPASQVTIPLSESHCPLVKKS